MNEILKEDLITFAESLGFNKIRIAKAIKKDEDIQRYSEWLDNNYHADMLWMENNLDKKADVKNILANAKSVIVLAYSYNKGINHSKAKGKIARYAWGKDYHNFIPKKLKKITKFLNERITESNSKAYVDTGPVMDRVWARDSGIGWQGKNSLILDKELGSYFFIATIITDIEFQTDEIQLDRCGKCTKCIEACPTNAIIRDKVVDSNKCISYWTIESKKDEIEHNIKKANKEWLFGCDICQEVCPWNNHKNTIQIEDFVLPRYGQTNLNIDDIIKLKDDEFKLRFEASPIKRPKLKGLMRNAQALN